MHFQSSASSYRIAEYFVPRQRASAAYQYEGRREGFQRPGLQSPAYRPRTLLPIQGFC